MEGGTRLSGSDAKSSKLAGNAKDFDDKRSRRARQVVDIAEKNESVKSQRKERYRSRIRKEPTAPRKGQNVGKKL
jgi:hypothetical protein